MRLVKKEYEEYWINDKGQCYGEYKSWWHDGRLREHFFYVNDEIHGERKWWYKSGQLVEHFFYANDEIVRDLLKEPVDEEDKFLLTLEHGGRWLCG